jgi:hypothetical protein
MLALMFLSLSTGVTGHRSPTATVVTDSGLRGCGNDMEFPMQLSRTCTLRIH